MSWFSSLLLIVCVYVSMVVATSESESHEVMIAKHLTAAAHSFHTFQTSGPTSSIFGPVNGASAACKATSGALEANSTIKAALSAVTKSGCTNPGTQQSCSSITRTCTCIAYYSNDANLRSLVSQSGGQVCSVNMIFTATVSDGSTANFNYQGIGNLGIVGSSCISSDIQAMLSLAMDFVAEGLRQANTQSNNKVQSISGTMSFCGTSYTGYRNGAYNNKPIGIAIALLIGTIITIINQAL